MQEVFSQSDDDDNEDFPLFDRLLSGASCHHALISNRNVHIQSNLRRSSSTEVFEDSSSTGRNSNMTTAKRSLLLHFNDDTSDGLDDGRFLNNVTSLFNGEEGAVDGLIDKNLPKHSVDVVVFNALALALELHQSRGWSQVKSAKEAKVSVNMLRRYLFNNT